MLTAQGTPNNKNSNNDKNELDEEKLSDLEEDLKKDSQLRQAVSLLSGWDIMASSLKKNAVIDKSKDPPHK